MVSHNFGVLAHSISAKHKDFEGSCHLRNLMIGHLQCIKVYIVQIKYSPGLTHSAQIRPKFLGYMLENREVMLIFIL